MEEKKIGAVIHFGFLTFALVFTIALIIISVAMPELFQDILNAISAIAKAMKGEATAVLALIKNNPREL